MRDVPVPPELVQDPYERRVPGLGVGRDPERSPMQWDGSPNAGLCPPDARPWLPPANDTDRTNVAAQDGAATDRRQRSAGASTCARYYTSERSAADSGSAAQRPTAAERERAPKCRPGLFPVLRAG